MKKRNFIILILVFAAAMLFWVGCSTQEAVVESGAPEDINTIAVKWEGSAHADASSEAFVQWNEDDPAEVPTNCAACHSTSGYIDYLGADGSAFRSVEEPGRIEDPVNCMACHNNATAELDSVLMPSGIEITGLDSSAVCMTCHGARTSQASVDNKNGDTPLDEVVAESSAVNPHYAVAAATLLGSEGNAGYEYEGRAYNSALVHTEDFNSCTECHDPHTLHLQPAAEGAANICVTCHSEATSYTEYKNISMAKVDYDGDGTTESVYYEIQGANERLAQAIAAYSKAVTGDALAFGTSYPYTFKDTNGDGVIDESEGVFPNQFNSFTPRLQKAAYNWLFIAHDGGNYIHNPKYVIQLAYDSIADLAELSGVTTEGMKRP